MSTSPAKFFSNYTFNPATAEVSFNVGGLPFYSAAAFDPDTGDIRRVSLVMVEGLTSGILALPQADRPKHLVVNKGGWGVTGSGEQIRRTYSLTYNFNVTPGSLDIQPE